MGILNVLKLKPAFQAAKASGDILQVLKLKAQIKAAMAAPDPGELGAGPKATPMPNPKEMKKNLQRRQPTTPPTKSAPWTPGPRPKVTPQGTPMTRERLRKLPRMAKGGTIRAKAAPRRPAPRGRATKRGTTKKR